MPSSQSEGCARFIDAMALTDDKSTYLPRPSRAASKLKAYADKEKLSNLEPSCCKKGLKKVPTKKVVYGIGDV